MTVETFYPLTGRMLWVIKLSRCEKFRNLLLLQRQGRYCWCGGVFFLHWW